jgi:hypothetical protein
VHEPPPDRPDAEPSDKVIDLDRMLREIRRDHDWIAAETGVEPPAPTGETSVRDLLVIPAEDVISRAEVESIERAIAALRAFRPERSQRPVVGSAVSALQGALNTEIRAYVDRQADIDALILAALQQIVSALNPIDLDGRLGKIWQALGALALRLDGIERQLRGTGDPSRLEAIEHAVASLKEDIGAMMTEIEPIGAIRVALRAPTVSNDPT